MNDQHGKYPGQGNNVPEAFGRGAWIYEPAVYLSLDAPDSMLPGAMETLRGSTPLGDGMCATEIPAVSVARLMGMTIEHLMEGNREGRLRILATDVEPVGRATASVRVKIWLDGGEAEFTINRNPAGGTA